MHISNSLNAEAVRLLAAVIWNSIKKPSGKRCNFEEKRSLCFYLIVAQNPTFFVILIRSIIRTHFAIPLNTVHFRTSIISHVFYALGHSVQKMAKKKGYCLTLFDEMSIEKMFVLIRNFTALKDLRILEVRAGRGTLQITLYFSWSVVCIASGSSRWLTTSIVEVQKLRCLYNSWCMPEC